FDRVDSIFEDREGNIWIGAFEGLTRLRVKAFRSYTKQEGLNHNNVMSICEDKDGSIWMATWGGGVKQMRNGKFTLYPENGSGLAPLMLSIHQDHQGDLWFGADYNGGLVHFKDGKFTRYGNEEGLLDAAIRVVYEDRRGNFWIGTSKSLTLF